jgi:membrane associated rhomboid family serine protease
MYNSGGNSFQKSNPVVFNLMILNAMVWLAQVMITNLNLTQLGAMYYYKSPNFEPYQIVTSMFMHSNHSLNHLVMNMIGLYFFGVTLEKVWGSKRFLFFYLACGLAANILTQFAIPIMAKTIANAGVVDYQAALMGYSSLGASGAIMGLLAGMAYLFPNTPIYMMFVPFPIALKWLALIYVAYDLFGATRYIAGDNVGHYAHLFGALVGFLLAFYWNKTNKKTFY